MARHYSEGLKERVREAFAVLVERHPQAGLGDRWITDPRLRSELIQQVTQSPWTESDILECFLSLRKRSDL